MNKEKEIKETTYDSIIVTYDMFKYLKDIIRDESKYAILRDIVRYWQEQSDLKKHSSLKIISKLMLFFDKNEDATGLEMILEGKSLLIVPVEQGNVNKGIKTLTTKLMANG